MTKVSVFLAGKIRNYFSLLEESSSSGISSTHLLNKSITLSSCQMKGIIDFLIRNKITKLRNLIAIYNKITKYYSSTTDPNINWLHFFQLTTSQFRYLRYANNLILLFKVRAELHHLQPFCHQSYKNLKRSRINV